MRALSLLLLILPSCIITGVDPDHSRWDDDHEPRSAKTSMAKDAGKASTTEAKAKQKDEPKQEADRAALEFSLDMARRKLESAELSRMVAMMEAEDKVTDAKLGVEKAQYELQKLQDYEVARRLASADIALDRSAGRMADSKAELDQIIQMYEGEEFATSSKELVIERSKRNYALAQRGFELEQAERTRLEEIEIPRDIAEAARKLQSAELRLKVAERRLQMEGLSQETRLMEAREALRKAERAYEKELGPMATGDAQALSEEQLEMLQELGYLGYADGEAE